MASLSLTIQSLVHEEVLGDAATLLALQGLAGRVERLVGANELRGRLDALVDLVQWCRMAEPDPPSPGAHRSAEAGQVAAPVAEPHRWSLLVTVLESPAVRPKVANALLAVFREVDAVHLLAETGLPSGRGLIAEAWDRVLRGVLPAPRDDHDLSRLLLRLFPSRVAATQLMELPAPLFGRLCDALAPKELPYLWDAVARAAEQAVCLLGVRVQALGLWEQLRMRSSQGAVTDSPYYRLPRIGELVLSAYQNGRETAAPLRAWRTMCDDCLAELQHVEYQLEAAGVSVEVVAAIDVIKRSLDRMDAMLRVLTASDPAGRADGVRALLKLLVWGQLSDRSVRELARSNLALLARKIVERAGEAGEHYITATRSEYWSMVRAAAGGGLLTVGTALFKLKLGAAHLGPFMTGALSGLNYSVSFILLQTFGLALATKQPAMTAATLARIIGEAHGDGWSHQQLEQLTAHVARTVRTQLAAAVSNVLSVCMGGAGLAVLWRTLWGGPLVAPAKAQASIASLHPLLTGTVFYAALTGVVLWLSSLVAGWVDNWSVCRRLPQAIAEHRWGERWGRARMERVAQLFQRNVAGWGGSISLGLMLAFTPELGAFFSLPLEVRHVTLSTGTLAIGAASLWPTQLLWRGVLFGGVGIATIFVMNLSVSFGLALLLALRARDVGVRESLAVLRRIFFRFLRHPGQFLLPPSARAAEGSLPT